MLYLQEEKKTKGKGKGGGMGGGRKGRLGEVFDKEAEGTS